MRKCVLCGNEYEYCPNCTKDRNKPTWYKLFDCENCHGIFNALNDYNFNLITKEDAQNILDKYDLSINLNDHFRNEIHEVMSEPAEIKVKKSKQVKKIEEVEEVKEELQVEIEPEVEI